MMSPGPPQHHGSSKAFSGRGIARMAPREHLPVKPARAEDVKPPIRKVQGV
jgi:hypothetical protein